MRARADQANLVHRLRHLGQEVAHLEAGDVGGDLGVLAANFLNGSGLQVKGIVMRKATSEVNQQHRLGSGPFANQPVGRTSQCALPRKHAGQRESQWSQCPQAQEAASREAIALGCMPGGEGDVDHGVTRFRLVVEGELLRVEQGPK